MEGTQNLLQDSLFARHRSSYILAGLSTLTNGQRWSSTAMQNCTRTSLRRPIMPAGPHQGRLSHADRGRGRVVGKSYPEIELELAEADAALSDPDGSQAAI